MNRHEKPVDSWARIVAWAAWCLAVVTSLGVGVWAQTAHKGPPPTEVKPLEVTVVGRVKVDNHPGAVFYTLVGARNPPPGESAPIRPVTEEFHLVFMSVDVERLAAVEPAMRMTWTVRGHVGVRGGQKFLYVISMEKKEPKP